MSQNAADRYFSPDTAGLQASFTAGKRDKEKSARRRTESLQGLNKSETETRKTEGSLRIMKQIGGRQPVF
jgi:hypothetical protein